MEANKNNGQNKWERWAGEKKPSMKRRCREHNYSDRGIYMITMAIEGRLPLLGKLTGDPNIKEGDNAPHIELSPLGKRVGECWYSIHQYYPAIDTLKLCIMPDHIHGILFVRCKMEKHLGHVINGFKAGCRKAAREIGLLPVKNTAAMPQSTGQAMAQGAGRAMAQGAGKAMAQSTGQAIAQDAGQRTNPWHPTHGTLWEPGFNDRILYGKGQLQRMTNYLDDNPRRLLLKRFHPEFFTHLGKLTVAGMEMDAMGNRFLLDNPVKIQVQCSRSLTKTDIEREKTFLLDKAIDQGAIIVSPCISPGEQQIATAAMTEGVPLIVLLLDGIQPLFKPAPRYQEACTEGRLLILAPFPYQNEKLENMRQRCLQLNNIASYICNNE